MSITTGSRLLVQIRENSSSLLATARARLAHPAEGLEKTSLLQGDFLLAAGHRLADSIVVSLRHLGLTSEGITVPQGQTGPLSLLGISGRGELSRVGGKWRLEMPITASVHYKAIELLLPFDVKDDRYIPRTETFGGRITGKLEEMDPGDNTTLTFKAGSTLNLEYSAGGLGWIQNFSVPFQGLTLSLLDPSSPEEAEFKLRVRPIGFKADQDDPSPSGAQHWRAQLDQAAAVWKHCGVLLDVQDFTILESRDRKTSADPVTVRGSQDPEAATVEIYFTAAQMADGGGVALCCGMAQAAIVVSDQQANGSLNLVAHEIGHVLCGIHPTDYAAAGEWNGEQGSVMEPVELIMGRSLGANSCGSAKQAAFEVVKT